MGCGTSTSDDVPRDDPTPEHNKAEQECGRAESKKNSNVEEMERIIQQYRKVVDPLVRVTFNTANTSAAERQNVCKAAVLFMRRDPNVAPGALPVVLAGVAGLAFVGDPGNEPTEIRFSGSQQVANWIADAQARGYAAGVRVVRFTV